MKLREVADQSEWENVPYVIDTKNHDYNAFQQERNKRLKSLRNQDNILASQYMAMEEKYPNEFKSRGVPDDADTESEYMEVPAEVEANPEAYDTIKIPGVWLYDMRRGEYYDPHEEFYLLKTSPRYKIVKRILDRCVQIAKMRSQSYMWPPTVQK